MSVWTTLQDLAGHALHTERIGRHVHLVTEDHSRVATQFKTADHTTAATTAVAKPPAGTALVLTDLIISGERINAGTIILHFTDDVDNVVLFTIHVTDAPVNLAMPFAGRWRGWKDARLDFITNTANQAASISIGYYIVEGEGVFTFADWDTLRG